MSDRPDPASSGRKPAKGDPAVKKKGGVFSVMVKTAVALALIAAVAAGGVFLYVKTEFERPGPTAESADVLLPPGSGLSSISAKLESDGLIRDRRIFRGVITVLGDERALKAGEYAVPAGASMRDIYELLRAGDVIEYALTIPEGLTSRQIVDLISGSDLLTGDIDAIPAEGSLLPETYRITRGASRQALLDRMARAQDDVIAELWPNRSEGLPYDTIEEAMIAASIVEKETGRADERGKVAAVVRNRLRYPMRLQMDSTIIYGEWLEDQSRPLNVEPLGPELRSDANPYNTYSHDGLPPTPIANPGRDAIAATLNPEPTPEGERPVLYFIASCAGDGAHHFTSTLTAHERYRAEWRRCRNSLRSTGRE